MTIHTHTTHTIYGKAYRIKDGGSPEQYGTEFEHHVIDGRVYVQIDGVLLDHDGIRGLSIDVNELQIREDHEKGVDDGL